MRRLSQSFAAAFAVTALLAGAALAADGWTTYRNDAFHVSIQTPIALTEKIGTTATAAGAVPTLSAIGALGQTGALFVTVGDYGAINSNATDDAILDGAVKGGVDNSHTTLDSVTNITVAGAPGRDVVSHDARTMLKTRILYKNHRIYAAIGAGAAGTPFPADYARFAGSMRVLP